MNKYSDRKKIIRYLVAIFAAIAFGLGVYVVIESRKSAVDIELSFVQRDSLLDAYKACVIDAMKEVATYDASRLPADGYQPRPHCRLDNGNCEKYLARIALFYSSNMHNIDIRLTDDRTINGSVTLEFPYILSLSIYLENNNEELKRTIVHEMAHLAYNNDRLSYHGDQKNCSYFQSIPLVCEYCFTGKATFVDNFRVQFLNSTQKGHVCTIYSHD